MKRSKFLKCFITNITAIKNDIEIWCQIDHKMGSRVETSIDSVHNLLSDLFSINSQNLRPIPTPEVGRNYLTHMKNDLHFHRVVVTHIEEDLIHASVLFIDFGVEEWVPFNHLVEWDDLFSVEPLAHKFYLADIQTKDREWNSVEVKRSLESYLMTTFQCEVISVNKNTECLRVYDQFFNQPLVQSLVKYCNGFLTYPSYSKDVFEAIDLSINKRNANNSLENDLQINGFSNKRKSQTKVITKESFPKENQSIVKQIKEEKIANKENICPSIQILSNGDTNGCNDEDIETNDQNTKQLNETLNDSQKVELKANSPVVNGHTFHDLNESVDCLENIQTETFETTIQSIPQQSNEVTIPEKSDETTGAQQIDETTGAQQIDETTVAQQIDETTGAQQIDETTVAQQIDETSLQIINETIIPQQSDEPTIPPKSDDTTVAQQIDETIVSKQSNESTIILESIESTITHKIDEATVPQEKAETTVLQETDQTSITQESDESTVHKKSDESSVDQHIPEESTVCQKENTEKVEEEEEVAINFSKNFNSNVKENGIDSNGIDGQLDGCNGNNSSDMSSSGDTLIKQIKSNKCLDDCVDSPQKAIAEELEQKTVQPIDLCPYPELIGDKQSIFVTERLSDDSNRFYCQLSSQFDAIQNIGDKMNAFYDKICGSDQYILEINGVKIDDTIAARFTSDKLWYRALVKANTGSRLHLFYIDYGNEETVDIKECRQLTEEFNTTNLKAQAFLCQPIGDKISAQTIDKYINDMIEMVALFETFEKDCFQIKNFCVK